MANIRVISDNAIDRATLSCTPAAVASFPVTYLQAPRKSDLWRVPATSARLSATWPTAETIQAVALPFCDLSPTATMRVRLTNEAQATNLVAASEDFSNACWQGYWTKPALTTSVASPDGGTSATRLASTDSSGSTNNAESGLACFATGGASGRITASIWARCVSGTLAVMFGVDDANQASVTLTTTWQRLTYTSAGSLTITSGTSKVLNIHEAVVGNQAWEVFGAQSEVGVKASSYYKTSGSTAARPLGYIDSWQSYDIDSGLVRACPAPAAKLRGFTAAQAASAYAFGGGADACVWLTASAQAIGMAVDISDPANAQGFIEAGAFWAGTYWESATNFDYGASAQMVDSSKEMLTDSGDSLSSVGTMRRKVSIPMSKLSLADQEALWGILRSGGTRYPVFVSMFPGSANLALEARHQLLGKLVEMPAMALPSFNVASATLTIQSI